MSGRPRQLSRPEVKPILQWWVMMGDQFAKCRQFGGVKHVSRRLGDDLPHSCSDILFIWEPVFQTCHTFIQFTNSPCFTQFNPVFPCFSHRTSHCCYLSHHKSTCSSEISCWSSGDPCPSLSPSLEPESIFSSPGLRLNVAVNPAEPLVNTKIVKIC